MIGQRLGVGSGSPLITSHSRLHYPETITHIYPEDITRAFAVRRWVPTLFDWHEARFFISKNSDAARVHNQSQIMVQSNIATAQAQNEQHSYKIGIAKTANNLRGTTASQLVANKARQLKLVQVQIIDAFGEGNTAPKEAGVYILQVHGGSNYIGESRNAYNRLKTHKSSGAGQRLLNKGKDFTVWLITGPEMDCRSFRLDVETELINDFRNAGIELLNTGSTKAMRNTFTHNGWRSGVVLKGRDGSKSEMLSTKDCNRIERALYYALFGWDAKGANEEKAVNACEKFERFEEDYSKVSRRTFEEASQFLANCEDMYFKAIEVGIYTPAR